MRRKSFSEDQDWEVIRKMKEETVRKNMRIKEKLKRALNTDHFRMHRRVTSC